MPEWLSTTIVIVVMIQILMCFCVWWTDMSEAHLWKDKLIEGLTEIFQIHWSAFKDVWNWGSWITKIFAIIEGIILTVTAWVFFYVYRIIAVIIVNVCLLIAWLFLLIFRKHEKK